MTAPEPKMVGMGWKVCSACKKLKVVECFTPQNYGRLRRHSRCKQCQENHRRERKGSTKRLKPSSGLRRCSQCGEVKALSGFYTDKQYGWDSTCAACRRDKRRRYAEANRDKERAASRAWYQANREYAQAVGREQAARWRQENPERHRQNARDYRQDPDNKDTLVAQGQRKRARKRQAFVERVVPLVVLERDDGLCGLCGGDVDPAAFHVEHIIPLARGGLHNYENVQAAHPLCNERKSAQLI